MTNREIIQSFKQGGTGNCVSIANIKAALEIFGLYNIFNLEKNPFDNGFELLMRYGFEAEVKEQELLMAQQVFG